MKDEFFKTIGVWGQRHYTHLKRSSPTTINVMRMSGELEEYLSEINNQAQVMFEKLMKEYADSEGVTEQLKADDQMEWVGRMNDIKARVTNVVNCELIYT